MKYAIHKSIPYTAEQINDSINRGEELPGVETSIYADGWVIADPAGSHVEDWTRNKEDYRIETLACKDIENGDEDIIYDRVVPGEDGNSIIFVKE